MQLLHYPKAVQQGSITYYFTDNGIYREDTANGFCPFETNYPNQANFLTFVGLCNLEGETSLFRRAEWAYNLNYKWAIKLNTKILRWLEAMSSSHRQNMGHELTAGESWLLDHIRSTIKEAT